MEGGRHGKRWFPGALRRASLAIPALTALLAAAVPALGASRSVFSPASPPASWIRDLFVLVLAIIGAIFVIVEGVLVYSMFRFRSRGKEDEKEEPAQVYGSRPIEAAWTVGPLLIVFVLFLVVYRTVNAIAYDKPPKGAMHVTVVAHQWWWEFRYPKLGIVTANELHVPAGRPVYLTLTSADVDHSFWVPRLAGKTACIPGRTNHTWFTAQKAGVFHGQCAVFCGTQHANMKILVVAQGKPAFEKWVADEHAPAADDPSVAVGRGEFLSLSCTRCHAIRGTSARGTVGPDLTHLMSRRTIGAGAAPNDREDLLRWVFDPQTIKPGCHMPSMHLDEGQVRNIVDYLETLK